MLRVFGEMDWKDKEAKEVFLEGCLKSAEEFPIFKESVIEEYCECSYNYLIDNYSSKELTQTMIEYAVTGENTVIMEDSINACLDKFK